MTNYEDDLHAIVDIMSNGGVILCPTDTIWGISCNAFNKSAVENIYKIKKRDTSKPFILLIDSIQNLKKYIKHIHPRIETLIYYHLRPVSVVYEASSQLPSYLFNDDKTVAIRVTKDPMLKEIIKKLGHPIVSTSANISGDEIPQTHAEIHPSIINSVDYICKSRRGQKNTQSSMLISFDKEGELIFLRK